MHHKLCSSLYGIVTNVLYMDSGFEDKQNKVLVMTRKGIYMYEGCPSKSWTFVITRDCVPGIL